MPCRGVERRWRPLRVGALGLVLVLTGCLAAPVPSGPLPTAEQLLEHLGQRPVHVSLRGLAQAQVDTPQGRQRFTQVLLLQRPDRIRAEVLGLFNQPALLLASDGRQLTVALPASGEYYQGVPDAENLQRFIGLPLAPAQLVALLLGDVPLQQHVTARVVATADGVALQLEGDAGGQTFRFDRQQRLLTASYRRQGEEWLQLSYDDYDSAGVPRQMTIALPAVALTATLRYSELAVDVSLEPQRFVLRLPDDTVAQPLP